MELGADGAIVLRAPANAATIVRRIPGARHDAKRQVWLLPLSWGTCVIARGIIGDALQVGPRLAEWARVEMHNRIHPAMQLRDLKDLSPDDANEVVAYWARVFDEIEVDDVAEG